jgi:hypothetical protein
MVWSGLGLNKPRPVSEPRPTQSGQTFPVGRLQSMVGSDPASNVSVALDTIYVKH